MFKKLKDKLAEEVKSSPQRIQQFAQAAQAAVTSASSSISDITNSDLFSIGDNDAQQSRPARSPPGDLKNTTFQDISLNQPNSLQTSLDSMDFVSAQDLNESQRQRRLSNSSFASDVSFRLPSYESPSMYHLQSDMEVSASEAEERSFSSGNVSLDRVTKEQIYAAYRRTQERYTKYRTQYADLARHYKLLERDNAKARSVLVETQDKALRRISELREQCSLEQSAKAHLEKALRVDIEEKNLKIDTLNTKIRLLQENTPEQGTKEVDTANKNDNDSNIQLISFDCENNHTSNEAPPSETVNNKIKKLENLLTKYKESLKTVKEKNAQLTTEIQILSSEVGAKNKEIDQLNSTVQQLNEANKKIEILKDLNEELQNQINVYDFNKNKEITTLELDLQKAQEQITELKSKINVFSKREEEYAISLAENKLSIHKELENKESEIKSLKDRLTESRREIQSLDIVLNDYKNNASKLEDECSKHKSDIMEHNSIRAKNTELESQLQVLTQKCQALESIKTKAEEEYKCLQLQLKQETAEKLAMIDRNTYLENRNTQLTEDISKKSSQVNTLEKELQAMKYEKDLLATEDLSDKEKVYEEVKIWKDKCTALESEIQEEREELGKLQSEIEKLLTNDDLIQMQNSQLRKQVDELVLENKSLRGKQSYGENLNSAYRKMYTELNDLKRIISLTSEETIMLKETNNSYTRNIRERLDSLIQQYKHSYTYLNKQNNELRQEHKTEIEQIVERLNLLNDEKSQLKSQLREYESSKIEADEQMRHTTEEFERSLKDLIFIRNEKDELVKQLNDCRDKCQELQNLNDHNISELIVLKQKNDNMSKSFTNSDECLKQENCHLIQLLEESKVKCEQLQNIINYSNDEKLVLDQNITDMAEKIDQFKRSMELMQAEKESLTKEIEESNAKCAILQDIIDSNNNDQTILKQTIDKLEHTIESITCEKLKIAEEWDGLNAKCEILRDIISRNNNEQTILKENISELEQENHLLKAEIKGMKEGIDNEISNYKQEHSDLIIKLTKAEDNQTIVANLQHKINDLTQENFSLRSQSEEITNSINNLEIELQEVRKSHNEIEIEKDRLNAIIQQLETKENICLAKNMQTDHNNGQNNETGLTFEEVQLIDRAAKESSLSESKDAFQVLVQENDSLKEENKRLQSDVAGIQTYLAKISKENSKLNDKLRELMASGENTQDNANLADLKNEIQQGKDKLDELIRENSLLEEENLELKDQLNSQHFSKLDSDTNVKDADQLNLKEKYTSLLDINSRLESRMLDLEQMNKSANVNMSQMQQQNEKLKLTNEKLERRLDEALVSLRHLHALQENTELEYLRNILYEYLTGTGAHSVTLAKVLAAVVKFDKTQTDQVLQKEKERQGFLKQLGLL